MAPAGVISPVPGTGGRALLFAAARLVSPHPSTASPRYVAAAVFPPLPAMRGFAAAAPGMARRAALLPIRSTSLHSSMGTARRGEVAAASACHFSSAGGNAASSRTTRSASRRLAAAAGKSEGMPAQAMDHRVRSSVFRARAARRGEVAAVSACHFSSAGGIAASSRTTRSASRRLAAAAGKSEGMPAQEEGLDKSQPPPQPRYFARVTELLIKLKEGGKKNPFAVTVVLLIIALGIAVLACVKNPGSDYAVLIVNICDKAEKVYKDTYKLFNRLGALDIRDKNTVTISNAHEGMVAALAASNASGLVASVSYDQLVKLWK